MKQPKVLRPKLKSGLESTQTPVTAQKSLLQLAQEAIHGKVSTHLSCRNLTYDVFIYISVTGDTKPVGGPFNWYKIQEEYSSLIKSTKAVSILQAWQKLEWEQARYNIGIVFLNFLKEYYDIDIATALVENGFSFVDDHSNIKRYQAQLALLESEIKTCIVYINQYRRDYERLLPQDGEVKNRTELDFEEELIVLSEHVGYRLDKKVITVYEVCAIINIVIAKNNGSKKV